jgi:dienelactone hydrolase
VRLVASVALVTMCASLAAAQPQNVDIPAADGTLLRATYFSPGQPGPAILLLHQCNMDRHAWDGLAATLATNGFHVLTFTLRGFSDGAATMPEQPLPQWPADAETALAYLLAQPGVDIGRVAAGGASCGVEHATNLAITHPEIRALMLLSGDAAPEGVAYVRATPSVAVFGAATTGDQLASGTRTVVSASRNPKSTVKMYAGADHGVAMFRPHPELPNAIVQWLQAQLTPATK